MTSPPGSVWVNAVPNERQGAVIEHAFPSLPPVETNVRCAASAENANATAIIAGTTSCRARISILISCFAGKRRPKHYASVSAVIRTWPDGCSHAADDRQLRQLHLEPGPVFG